MLVHVIEFVLGGYVVASAFGFGLPVSGDQRPARQQGRPVSGGRGARASW
jgi:hypothetical protein